MKGATLDGGEADIILSDDIFESIRLDVSNFPLLISVCKVISHFNFIILSTEKYIDNSKYKFVGRR